MNKPIILIYHIPKTGGVSILHYLETHLRVNRDIVHAEAHPDDHSGLPWLQACTQTERDDLKLVLGHSVTGWITRLFPNRECQFHTTLREPVSRMTSNLNYCLGHIRDGNQAYYSSFPWVQDWERFRAQLLAGEVPAEFSIEAFIAEEEKAPGWPNYQCYWLEMGFPQFIADHGANPFEKALGILSHFAHVSTTDHLEAYGNRLAKRLEIPPFNHHHNRSIPLISTDFVRQRLPPKLVQYDGALHCHFLQKGL